ncbi:hypothetical protein [Persephonella sp.]
MERLLKILGIFVLHIFLTFILIPIFLIFDVPFYDVGILVASTLLIPYLLYIQYFNEIRFSIERGFFIAINLLLKAKLFVLVVLLVIINFIEMHFLIHDIEQKSYFISGFAPDFIKSFFPDWLSNFNKIMSKYTLYGTFIMISFIALKEFLSLKSYIRATLDVLDKAKEFVESHKTEVKER